MANTRIEEIADSLMSLATLEMSPKKLWKAVRRMYPKASNKKIAQAAFYSVISSPDEEPAKAKKLHAFAIKTRSSRPVLLISIRRRAALR